MDAQEIVRSLTLRGQTLCVAESLTGGKMSDSIVSVPGASKVFLGGVVSYAESVKQKVLGVQAETLQQFTAVSGQTACEMAAGVRRLMGADYALSATGYAGPDGEDVGLVYIGFADANMCESVECRFAGDRAEIRRQSVEKALEILSKHLRA
ncbi:MAG: CinA family protein [Clostridia bacterium]|nr:CinA family protein [Clostridia bacterium]